MANIPEHWFQNSVLYQIYPRSFADSNGDGIGDLKGIINKLDYLNGKKDSLGVTSIWISPFYPSPMADFGYDVSDYCDIDPIFGDLADFKNLLEQAHQRGIRVLIDLVPNHSSDEHIWFKESRSSKTNPYRDWYTWRDPKPDGSPPNNWLSHFGGSAWAYDESSQQYYLHSFLEKQPDLNWDNPNVREAMHNVMRFWLDMGVDGFRADWVAAISKDPELRDELPNPKYNPDIDGPHSSLTNARCQDGPNLYNYLNGMSEILATYSDKFMVTEAYPEKIKKPGPYMKFYEKINPVVCAPLNFAMIYMEFKAKKIRKFVDHYQRSLKPGYVPIYSTGNHDQSRIATRYGYAGARIISMMTLTLPGVPLMYYGDEIGMKDVNIPLNAIQDPFELRVPGEGNGRDPYRTPMQWDNTEGAGFSLGQPWLPLSTDAETINVKIQNNMPGSSLTFFREMIAARKTLEPLRTGGYHLILIQKFSLL